MVADANIAKTNRWARTDGWPNKVQVFGVGLSCTDYDDATDCIIAAAQRGERFVVDFISVDPLVQSTELPPLKASINRSELVCPDGHPVRVAMNLLHGSGLKDRVCGPDTTDLLLRKAENIGLGVYFYGSTEATLVLLSEALKLRYPQLLVSGLYSPPFRELSIAEQADVVRVINESGAKLVFIGLGAPKQSLFADRVRNDVNCGLLCVGAAFGFLAGTETRAPVWMRKTGLEWCFRLAGNPKRLLKRYSVTNVKFLRLLFAQLLTQKRGHRAET